MTRQQSLDKVIKDFHAGAAILNAMLVATSLSMVTGWLGDKELIRPGDMLAYMAGIAIAKLVLTPAIETWRHRIK